MSTPDRDRARDRLAQIRRVVAGRALRAAAKVRFGLMAPGRRRTILARELRTTLETLGPTFVKLGQIGSVRADVFGQETLAELDRLRDNVEPVPTAQIREVIERSFSRGADDVFAGLVDEPLASASIAQVHRAVLAADYRPVWGEPLLAGAPLAVKVVRPGARVAVRSDVAAAREALRTIPRVGPLARFDLDSLVEELDASLERELDMRVEGRTADHFAFDFRHDPIVTVPRVVWPLTTRDVLTMEYIEGWPLTRLDEAQAAGVNARALAEHGADAFMRQVLVAGRYHADLHHANLLVTPEGRLAYLDFGMVGTLDADERRAVAQLLASLVYHDAPRMITWTEALGVPIPPEVVDRLAVDLRRLMDRTLDPSGAGLRGFGLGLLGLLRRYGIRIASGYGLLIKALVTVEGVSRRLYPDIDMMATAGPFVTGMLAADALSSGELARRVPRALSAAAAEFFA